MYNIAIICTTFLRDNLLYKTLENYKEFMPENSIVLVGDQGYCSDEKNITIDYYKSQIPLEYYKLPFDCGLSYARNFLVNKAKEMGIPYILLMADSIQFNQKDDFSSVFSFMEQYKSDLVGFELDGSKAIWEYLIEVKEGRIFFKKPEFTIPVGDELVYRKIEICRNIFLSKTDVVNNCWDNNLKVAEHEDFFITLKNKRTVCYWTNAIRFKRIGNSKPKEYMEYRNRFNDYLKLFKLKHNLTGWVTIEK